MVEMETVVFVSKVTEDEYEKICNIAEKMKGLPPFVIHEAEEYYNVPEGRLWAKRCPSTGSVRFVRDGHGMYASMIFDAERSHVATKLQGILKACVGYRGIIVKMCQRFVVGQTRIHVDKVDDVGYFVKIAVICEPDQSIEEGEEIARVFQKRLGITDEQRIKYTSYIDILAPKPS